MKWISHIAIASAICAVVNPAAVPAAVLGSTSPDWLEWLLRSGGRRTVHRGLTHYLVAWLAGAGFAYFVVDWRGWLLWFCLGGAIHWLCDALTSSGAPLGPWSTRRTTLFGGRVKTGGASEYTVTVLIVVACGAIIYSQRGVTGTDHVPFFPDWAGHYDTGRADAKEWRDNRFKLF
jgi:inner membrane protein